MFSFLSKKFGQLFDALKGIKTLNEKNVLLILQKAKEILIDADVPVEIIEEFLKNLKDGCLDVKLPSSIDVSEYVSKKIYDDLLSILSLPSIKVKKGDHLCDLVKLNENNLLVIMLIGLQGAGKTTTVGKVVAKLIGSGAVKKDKVVVASIDFKRPAALQQLSIVGKNAGVDVYESKNFFSDPKISAVEEALLFKKRAEEDEKKVLIIDSAGRISLDEELMNELSGIKNLIPSIVNILIVDSMMGQGGLSIAESFAAAVPCSGVILTKVDSDAPCGIALGLTKSLKLPLWYMTRGEKNDEMDLFNPVRVVRRILGMGDFLALAEMAQKKIVENDEFMIKQAVKRGDISIDEFVRFIKMIQNFGPLKNMFSALPRNYYDEKIDDGKLNKIEQMHKKFVFMRDSMTKKERRACVLLDDQHRKLRIMKGAGITSDDYDDLLRMYKQIKERMKSMPSFLRNAF